MSKFGTKEDAKKQMAAMGLNAPYIGSEETRTEEEIEKDRKTLAENVPILGEAMLAKEIASDVKDENYLSAGLNTAALAVGVIPGVGKVASRPIRTIAKSMRKGYNPEDPASRVFHLTKKDFDTADVVGKGTSDIGFHVGTSAQANARGSTGFNYDRELAEKMVAEERVLPLVLKEKLKPARIPDISSFKSPQNWIGNLSVAKSDRSRIKFLLGEQADADLLAKAPKVTVDGDTYYMLPDVMREGMDPELWKDLILEANRAKRNGLDTISKQEDRIAWFSTLKHTANKHGYDSFVYKNEYEGVTGDTLLNNDSYMLLEADQAKGLFGEMTEGSPEFMKNKGGLMLQNGGAIPMNNMAQQMELFEPAKNNFDSGGLTKSTSGDQLLIDFNAIAEDYNESRNISGSQRAVTGAEMMAVFDSFIGSKVKLAPTGGMAEGGLLDEGGTKDPVSGNDVPPGSTQEEVRDDIPAQLSEGEFVFPADVVRFIGLEKLMMIRQRAKAGLKMMEDMGQMGNSEEAIMPDDLPFSIEDLDMEDDGLEMAQGGVVNAANGTFVQPTPTNTNAGVFFNPASQTNTGVATAPVKAASSTQNQPVQSSIPEVDVTAPQETFENYIGQNIPGVNFKYVTYIDENGNKIQLRQSLTSNEMLDPVPEGYKLFDAEKAKVDTATSQTTRVQSTTDDGDGGGADDEGITTGASITLGGKAVGPAQGLGIPGTRFAGPSRRVKGATIYDVSFKNVGLKNMLNPAGFAFNMIKEDGGLPPGADAVVGVRGNKKATIELPAVAYNTLRNDPRGQQAKTVQEALAARDALTSGNKASYVDGVLSVENKDGDMVTVSKEAIDLIGSTMYSEIKAEADGTFGFGKTDNLVDTASDYYSGMSDTEEQNARNALSAYNDQQFSDFISQDEVYGDTNEGQQEDNNVGDQDFSSATGEDRGNYGETEDY